jgi:hypothetical protein
MTRADLPPGVSPAALDAALAAFASVVGDAFVQTSDDVLAVHEDEFHIGDPTRHTPSAVVLPEGVEEVRAIVRIAGEHRIPLWTVSTGRNLGYGGSAPRVPGSVLLELSRMNRILEVDEKLAYALVEPGVRFFDLYEHRIARDAFGTVADARFASTLYPGDVTDEGLHPVHRLQAGIPNLDAYKITDWPGAPGRGGHLSFGPIAPLDGQEAPRYLSHIFMIAFDRDDWDEAQRAKQLLDVLVTDAAAEGYGEYRAHLAHMDLIAQQYGFNDGAMGRFNARIKSALDPSGVLT